MEAKMVEIWATFKVWIEYIIPIAIFILIVTIAIVSTLVSYFRWSRKVKYLEKNGFTRYLHDVSSCGGDNTYAWKNEETGQIYLEWEIKRLSYKNFKEKLGDVNETKF